ncbi:MULTISPECIES: sensor domain-containing diguanylate cyclase [Bordetella]|uniref:Diguanylate cyclase BdcA n=4 Tax=Bordetella TaxID=517 RepID=BDCA_BORBR|nr:MULTISPECIES: sensor domain-containing diguanylate cyclase [Bordetella]KAK64378.1 diguanylate cyclase (GGDEF) domain protein [Bordetella bronchiseptica 980-2]SHS84790.1 PAS/PAC sensor-containing diguanylate cyclase [Mycobacteroides abscessus subsp. abscessus]AMG89664.1 GGDEF domain-containing protein [Bordetella bronchiseptica]AWP76164.1 sensor domain-containing diguanylate cyclase [Bordetella bronchiseptica]AWP81004.1 sensor domain-containing diguanylate cyclase [Bordetella bronchiseptica]
MMRQLDLRRLILGLSMLSLLLALAGTLYASAVVQRDILLSSTLEDNRVYARKLALAADDLLANAMRDLAYGAQKIGERPDSRVIAQEVERLQAQTNRFNAVTYVDANGVFRAVAPHAGNIVGRPVVSAEMRQALEHRGALISDPFIAPTGRWLIAMSQPVFGPDGAFAGVLSGLFYLHEGNALKSLLGERDHRNGSYQYAVDRQGVLLYHPQATRIGESQTSNPLLAEVRAGRGGAQRFVNTLGTEMLAGYAVVPATGWGVVAQRPVSSVVAATQLLVRRTVYALAIWVALGVLCVWWLADRISRPLSQLARAAAELDNPRAADGALSVRAWYREALQIKNALMAVRRKIGTKFEQLRQDSLTDPLTGLLNRRGLEEYLRNTPWQDGAMTVLALDIDRFKIINDTHGHAAGDEVIQSLAGILRSSARTKDVLARLGGEEFAVLLPDVDVPQAPQLAERIRRSIEAAPTEAGVSYTVSIGVACYPAHGASLEAVMRCADEALYAAKAGGRNRTHLYRVGMPLPASLTDAAAGSEPSQDLRS